MCYVGSQISARGGGRYTKIATPSLFLAGPRDSGQALRRALLASVTLLISISNPVSTGRSDVILFKFVHTSMADYSIFREQLATRFPTYGHALWDPRPPEPGMPVRIGDVGFIRGGKFHCLFNALCPKGDQLYVPEGYEPLVLPKVRNVTQSLLNAGHYCSTGVRVEPELPQYASR